MPNWVYSLSIIVSIVLGLWALNALFGRRLMRMSDSATGCLVVFAIFAIILFGLVGYYIPRLYENFEIGSYRQHLQGYSGPWLPTVSGTRPYINGRVITVQKLSSGGLEISPLFLRLPADLRPSNPADVKTIVQLQCSWFNVGAYAGGAVLTSNDAPLT